MHSNKNHLILPSGDRVRVFPKAIVIDFIGKRNVISTSLLNGGYSENLNHVFNFDGKKGMNNGYDLGDLSYEEHLVHVAHSFGLPPRHTTAISTTADMKNASLCIETCKNLSVCAIITAGVKGNSGRAGDPSSFDERELPDYNVKSGTINILLQINANMPPGTLSRVLMTCTEAKSVALQELLIGSKYSMGMATGTGTDGCIIMGNLDSPIKLTNAGKHSKLGELIGITVINGVKRAIKLQENIDRMSQKKVFTRLQRFQITPTSLFQYYKSLNDNEKLSWEQFEPYSNTISEDFNTISCISLITHLLDEYQWNLLTRNELILNLNFLLEKKSKLFLSDMGSKGEKNKEFFQDVLTHIKDYLIKLILKEHLK